MSRTATVRIPADAKTIAFAQTRAVAKYGIDGLLKAHAESPAGDFVDKIRGSGSFCSALGVTSEELSNALRPACEATANAWAPKVEEAQPASN